MRPLILNEGAPKFAQLYIIENDLDQVDQRISNFSNVGMHRELLHQLQQYLHQINPFVVQFQKTIQDLQNRNIALEEIYICIQIDGQIDHHRYNVPTGNGQQEVAGFIPDSEDRVLIKEEKFIFKQKEIQISCISSTMLINTCLSRVWRHNFFLHDFLHVSTREKIIAMSRNYPRTPSIMQP